MNGSQMNYEIYDGASPKTITFYQINHFIINSISKAVIIRTSYPNPKHFPILDSINDRLRTKKKKH